MQALLKKKQDEQKMREMLANGEKNAEATCEERFSIYKFHKLYWLNANIYRVSRCKHLQYEMHEELFSVNYTTIHKVLKLSIG
jgi:acyl-CoA synthetase (AMP-forming)/AMP-acid ligase II